MHRDTEVSGDDVSGAAPWPGLVEARIAAARLGASSVGTEHVLLSLLSGPEDDATRALRGAGVDYRAIAVALDAIVGPAPRPASREPEELPLSPRVRKLLVEAEHRPRGAVRDAPGDHDVLAALLDSDDECVAALVINYVGARRRTLDALHARDQTVPAVLSG